MRVGEVTAVVALYLLFGLTLALTFLEPQLSVHLQRYSFLYLLPWIAFASWILGVCWADKQWTQPTVGEMSLHYIVVLGWLVLWMSSRLWFPAAFLTHSVTLFFPVAGVIALYMLSSMCLNVSPERNGRDGPVVFAVTICLATLAHTAIYWQTLPIQATGFLMAFCPLTVVNVAVAVGLWRRGVPNERQNSANLQNALYTAFKRANNQ